jgi:glycosyltransferase involved in cell wall biosynthesis
MATKISIVIPVRNEEVKIEGCLRAVFNQTQQPFEVIVVDGHSTDSTITKAKEFPVAILFENYHTRAGACKVGVENATGEFIAFTDADCLPDTGWLENLIKEFDNNIVGVGGRIKNKGKGLWEVSINLSMGTFLGSGNSVQGREFNERRYVNSISGCNCMYRKKDILSIGGFDVELTTAEDTKLNAKLLTIGKILYTPNAIVFHDHRRGIRAFAKRMYQYGMGRAQARLWDIQVIPPIMALVLIASLIITPYMLLSVSVIYILLIFLNGLEIMIKEKNPFYLVSIPFIYFIEHSMYIIGFWRGFL